MEINKHYEIENTDIFRKAFAEYISLCKIPPYIRLKNNEPREIYTSDYRLSLPYNRPELPCFTLYVDMKEAAFNLLLARSFRVEHENNIPLHIKSSNQRIICLEGLVEGMDIQYVIYKKNNIQTKKEHRDSNI